MLTASQLKNLAKARLTDAVALLNARRYDGAVYMCGYSVELACKARICRTLKWNDFPETAAEFNKGLKGLKIHDLDVLIKFTGREQIIKTKFIADWSVVLDWSPDVRYKPVGSASETDARSMVQSATVIFKKL